MYYEQRTSVVRVVSAKYMNNSSLQVLMKSGILNTYKIKNTSILSTINKLIRWCHSVQQEN